MNRTAPWIVAAVVALILCPAWAQDQPEPTPPAAQAKPKPNLDEPVAPDVLDKVRKMAEAGMQTLPAMLARRLDLSDAQQEAARQALQTRWDAMGREGQDKLLGVMVLGRQLHESGQATPEDWQKLARQAQPVVESAFKMLSDTADAVEKLLDEGQKAKLAQDLAGFRQGQQAMLARVKLVAEGQVKLEANGEPAGGWPDEAAMPGGRRGGDVQVVEEEVEETGPDGVVHKVKVKRIKSRLPDEETVAGDEKYWTPFLKGFIAKYDLDADQQKTARKLLGEALKRASETRQRLKQALDDARKRIKEAEAGDNADAVAAAHLAYEQLNRPIVLTFKDLARALDNLLSFQQREAGKSRGELFGGKKKD